MKTLLIVWHSRTGGSRQMAQAAADAARAEAGVEVRLLAAEAAMGADVLGADGYLFCCPENLASISGEMKAFFDRTYYEVLDQVAGRPYALLVCAGSDGQGVVRQVSRICTGWRLKAVAEPVVVITGAQDGPAIWAAKTIGPKDLARCGELGGAMAAGLAMGVF